MSAEHAFPRFHYLNQFYYYLAWYLMLFVSSQTTGSFILGVVTERARAHSTRVHSSYY